MVKIIIVSFFMYFARFAVPSPTQDVNFTFNGQLYAWWGTSGHCVSWVPCLIICVLCLNPRIQNNFTTITFYFQTSWECANFFFFPQLWNPALHISLISCFIRKPVNDLVWMRLFIFTDWSDLLFGVLLVWNPMGYSDIFYTYIGSGNFLGSKILNFNIFGVFFFQKNEYFLGYEVFVDIFLGSHKTELYLGVISMHFRVFS